MEALATNFFGWADAYPELGRQASELLYHDKPDTQKTLYLPQRAQLSPEHSSLFSPPAMP
jgi:hypothetical protein